MRQKSGPGKAAGDRSRDQRHPPRHAATFFRRRQDPDRAGGPSRRGQHRRAVPPRGHCLRSMYYGWSKEFLEAGKRRLAGDTARAATSDEVKDLRREAKRAEGGRGRAGPGKPPA